MCPELSYPHNATAASEPEMRKVFKVVTLATNYGMGSVSMAQG